MVDGFETAGWQLANPRTSALLTFTLQGAVPIEREALIHALAVAGPAESQDTHWWLDDGATDAYYRLRRLNDRSVVREFALDGVDGYLDRIERDIQTLIRGRVADTTGLVFDRGGATEELDWDAVMAGADVPIDVVPDLLGLTQVLDRLHPDLPYEHRTFSLENLVIHDWANISGSGFAET